MILKPKCDPQYLQMTNTLIAEILNSTLRLSFNYGIYSLSKKIKILDAKDMHFF